METKWHSFVYGLVGAMVGCGLFLGLMRPLANDTEARLSNLKTELLDAIGHLDSRVERLSERQRQTNNLAAGNTARLSRVISREQIGIGQIVGVQGGILDGRSTSDALSGRQDMATSERVLKAAMGEVHRNPQAEAAFNADRGKPLGDRADTIKHTFVEAADLIDLEGVQCRTSICRVEYHPLELVEEDVGSIEDPDYLLIDRLSEQMGYADINVRFASREDGTRLMYIELP